MKRILRSKIFWSLLIVLVALRLTAPFLIRREINSFLADFSPVYVGHVGSIGLGIFRGAYQIRDFEVRLKEKPEEQFVWVRLIDISMAWRDLLHGRLTTDVWIEGAKLVLTQNVLDSIRQDQQTHKDPQKAAQKIFPLRVERVDIQDSDLQMSDLLSVPESSRLKLSKIRGRLSNLTATPEAPLTLASLKASVFDSTNLRVAAQINRLVHPLAWDADLEMKDFDLPQANPWLKKKLPLTFTSGKLDAYAEIKSENGKLVGYVKPFLRKADVITNRESFQGLKHFGIEISSAALNLILRNAKDKTLATKILFSRDDEGFHLNSAKALQEAIKNGFSEEIHPGIEDEIGLSAFHQKPFPKGDKP